MINLLAQRRPKRGARATPEGVGMFTIIVAFSFFRCEQAVHARIYHARLVFHSANQNPFVSNIRLKSPALIGPSIPDRLEITIATITRTATTITIRANMMNRTR